MKLSLFAAFIISTSSALAQTSSPINVFGTVAAVGTELSVILDDTKAVETYTMAPKLLVLRNRKVTISDIKPNDFVASAAARDADGRLHSIEVRIYPEALRGTGEGQRPMDGANSRTMTNATVTGTALVGDSNRLTVTFPGGQSELIVDPGVPVTRIESVDRAAVMPGMKVRVQGSRGPGGATVTRVTLLE
ncbi:MAG: hypothetical protein Q8M31_09090 [Beijerinckiaceae bacterium]|nr:hypothetical protein [Beijerinckiaceae bacterium]